MSLVAGGGGEVQSRDVFTLYSCRQEEVEGGSGFAQPQVEESGQTSGILHLQDPNGRRAAGGR